MEGHLLTLHVGERLSSFTTASFGAMRMIIAFFFFGEPFRALCGRCNIWLRAPSLKQCSGCMEDSGDCSLRLAGVPLIPY